jgi:hypothetical protein
MRDILEWGVQVRNWLVAAVALVGMAIAAIVSAVCALVWGVVTEFQQSRESGPIAREPTLPFAFQSTLMLATAGFVSRRVWPLPWWTYAVALPAYLVVAIALTVFAGRAGERRRQ